MDSEKQERFATAYRAAVEMNRQAWLRWPRRRTEAEVNAEVADALDVLARNGYDICPDDEWLAHLQATNYEGIGSQPRDPDGGEERPKAADPEAQKRIEAASRLARKITRQSWFDRILTEEEHDEADRCSEAWHLLDGYGYEGVQPPEEEPTETPYSPVVEKELVPQK